MQKCDIEGQYNKLIEREPIVAAAAARLKIREEGKARQDLAKAQAAADKVLAQFLSQNQGQA